MRAASWHLEKQQALSDCLKVLAEVMQKISVHTADARPQHVPSCLDWLVKDMIRYLEHNLEQPHPPIVFQVLPPF